MDIDRAFSLATFINDRSTRFHAEVLHFDSKGWVLIADNAVKGERRTHPEPITDPENYLRRAKEGLLHIDEECRHLVEYWVCQLPQAI